MRTLFLTLEEHLTFEAQAFPLALRDVIGWGAVLQGEIEESHARQRQALATALAALEPETLSWVELTRNVRAFAASLMRDIETEEAAALAADTRRLPRPRRRLGSPSPRRAGIGTCRNTGRRGSTCTPRRSRLRSCKAVLLPAVSGTRARRRRGRQVT